MKKAGILAAAILGISTLSPAQAEENLNKVGLGLGIPYGLLGANAELGLHPNLALTGGVGITPGGLGWAVGARAYGPKLGSIRPRLTALHGVVAILETQYWYGDSDYETITGNAIGIGLEWESTTDTFIELDILSTDADVPAGATQEGGDTKISIGYGVKF